MNQERQDIISEIPALEGKEGYLSVMFGMLLKISDILANGEMNSIRISLLTQLLVSLIPGISERKKITSVWKKLDTTLSKEWSENHPGQLMSNEDKMSIGRQSAIVVIGYIVDYVDLHIGIHRENRCMLSGKQMVENVSSEEY